MALSSASPTTTLTACSVSKRVVPARVAVTRTVFAPPPSARLSWMPTVSLSASTESAIAGAASSLVSLMAVPVTVTSVSSPSIEMLSSASWNASFVGVRANSTNPPAAPGAMVMVWSATAV